MWHDSSCRLAEVRRPGEAPMEVTIAGPEGDTEGKMTPIAAEEPEVDAAAVPEGQPPPPADDEHDQARAQEDQEMAQAAKAQQAPEDAEAKDDNL